MNGYHPSFRRRAIRIFFYLSKALGLFHIARRLTRRRIRVLCYHGFSLVDEHRFLPGLFMKPETFAQRMKYLADKQYPVIPLDDAVEQLDTGNFPDFATVITIDDGFFSVYKIGRPMLMKYEFTATLYLTTYYAVKQSPIFGLLVNYLFWLAPNGLRFEPARLDIPPLNERGVIMLDARSRAELGEMISVYGETQCSETERQSLGRQLAQLLGIDYDAIVASRVLRLINCSEAKNLEESGISIELHSHRHRFPINTIEATNEIVANRDVIEEMTGQRARHFCYPSGEWSREHWPILEDLGVRSATTCVSRLASPGTPRYAIPRILDDTRVSQIEFEAEMLGFVDLIRDFRARLHT